MCFVRDGDGKGQWPILSDPGSGYSTDLITTRRRIDSSENGIALQVR
jgi:hypothetical protein